MYIDPEGTADDMMVLNEKLVYLNKTDDPNEIRALQGSLHSLIENMSARAYCRVIGKTRDEQTQEHLWDLYIKALGGD